MERFQRNGGGSGGGAYWNCGSFLVNVLDRLEIRACNVHSEILLLLPFSEYTVIALSVTTNLLVLVILDFWVLY